MCATCGETVGEVLRGGVAAARLKGRQWQRQQQQQQQQQRQQQQQHQQQGGDDTHKRELYRKALRLATANGVPSAAELKMLARLREEYGVSRSQVCCNTEPNWSGLKQLMNF